MTISSDNHSQNDKILAVPTNIITGFLGVGKTSAILHLLTQKPADERWAVLVNEFGEIGIDGGLLKGQHTEEQGVFIREVPGGCMCCTAGLSMQIALNQLLAKARPDRLLIEPTGLGHPKEVIQVLTAPHYREVLSLQRTLTLVDARKLSENRYISHETFNQQIQIADVVVGNKADMYSQDDCEALQAYVKTWGKEDVANTYTEYGKLPLSMLDGPTLSTIKVAPPHHHHHHDHEPAEAPVQEVPLQQQEIVSAGNEGEGFESIGWRFAPDIVFNYEKLHHLLASLQVERLKGLFITDDGVFGYNKTADGLTEMELDDCMESRLEIIAETLDDNLEALLHQCIDEPADFNP
ncbi:CobW family GTP-binding protein [Alteromonas sp. C1M14]|uniref:CobW family GTP-binding protein n=1 Tax=Alteromonas sp. C1M14 TaxID=2841567 RepID=UPI001C086FA1|nr:CobW family GTP-binding protein [Alteromonas sp. C1M14]MBU2979987.1 GTP-binding protein [Alteromonas sp. C1M14]